MNKKNFEHNFVLENEIGKLKNEITRLESVLNQKQSTIIYLWEANRSLNEEAKSLKQKLKENKTPSSYKFWKKNNKAIYDTLIELLSQFIYDPKINNWKEREKQLFEKNKIINELINQLKNERNSNND